MYMVIDYIELHTDNTDSRISIFKLAAACIPGHTWFLELLLPMVCVYVCVSASEANDDYLYLD